MQIPLSVCFFSGKQNNPPFSYPPKFLTAVFNWISKMHQSKQYLHQINSKRKRLLVVEGAAGIDLNVLQRQIIFTSVGHRSILLFPWRKTVAADIDACCKGSQVTRHKARNRWCGSYSSASEGKCILISAGDARLTFTLCTHQDWKSLALLLFPPPKSRLLYLGSGFIADKTRGYCCCGCTANTLPY